MSAARSNFAQRQTLRLARAALWGVNEIISLTVASLLAGLATTPYAAFHFHRIAPYGVLANLLAMPIVSAWVMRMGILGVVTMPLGLDAEFWRQMGYGIEWMNAVGLWVASLPGAFGRVTLFGVWPLLLATVGLHCAGAASCRSFWQSPLPLRRQCRMCSSPPMAAALPCVASTAGSPCIMSAATVSLCANGSQPMPTRATFTIRV